MFFDNSISKYQLSNAGLSVRLAREAKNVVSSFLPHIRDDHVGMGHLVAVRRLRRAVTELLADCGLPERLADEVCTNPTLEADVRIVESSISRVLFAHHIGRYLRQQGRSLDYEKSDGGFVVIDLYFLIVARIYDLLIQSKAVPDFFAIAVAAERALSELVDHPVFIDRSLISSGVCSYLQNNEDVMLERIAEGQCFNERSCVEESELSRVKNILVEGLPSRSALPNSRLVDALSSRGMVSHLLRPHEEEIFCYMRLVQQQYVGLAGQPYVPIRAERTSFVSAHSVIDSFLEDGADPTRKGESRHFASIAALAERFVKSRKVIVSPAEGAESFEDMKGYDTTYVVEDPDNPDEVLAALILETGDDARAWAGSLDVNQIEKSHRTDILRYQKGEGIDELIYGGLIVLDDRKCEQLKGRNFHVFLVLSSIYELLQKQPSARRFMITINEENGFSKRGTVLWGAKGFGSLWAVKDEKDGKRLVRWRLLEGDGIRAAIESGNWSDKREFFLECLRFFPSEFRTHMRPTALKILDEWIAQHEIS